LLLRPSAITIALSLAIAGFNLAPQSTNPAQAAVGPGENPVELRLAALEAVMRSDRIGALDLFNTAIQQASKQYGGNSIFLADLYYEAGSVALDASQFGQAEHYLTLAVKTNPYSTMAKIKLAELYRVQDRASDAAQQFKQAVQVNPNSPVTRQAYIRWLSENSSTSTEKAIANQEAYRLAMLRAKSAEVVKGAPTVVRTLAPPMIPPKDRDDKGSRSEKSEKPKPSKPDTIAEPHSQAKPDNSTKENQKTSEIKESESKGPSLFPFRNLKEQKHDDAAAKKKASELAEQAKNAAKAKAQQEEADRKRLAREKAEREKERADRERADREKERAAQALAKAHAKTPTKSAGPEKAKQDQQETKPAEKAQKPAQKPAQDLVPNAMTMPMQPVYPVPGFIPPSQPKPNAKRGLVPPPPPAPIPVFPMMGQQQVPPGAAQQQAKPKPKPKETAKESPREKEPAKQEQQPEEKPATSGSSDGESDFLLDWAGTDKKKKGK
jgi:hypothetical protein